MRCVACMAPYATLYSLVAMAVGVVRAMALCCCCYGDAEEMCGSVWRMAQQLKRFGQPLVEFRQNLRLKCPHISVDGLIPRRWRQLQRDFGSMETMLYAAEPEECVNMWWSISNTGELTCGKPGRGGNNVGDVSILRELGGRSYCGCCWFEYDVCCCCDCC